MMRKAKNGIATGGRLIGRQLLQALAPSPSRIVGQDQAAEIGIVDRVAIASRAL